MRSLALLFIAFVNGCGGGGAARQQEGATNSTAVQSIPTSQRSLAPEYALAGYRLRLAANGEYCFVEHRAPKSASGRIRLDLRPPCHLLVWRQVPPVANAAGDVSDGVPVGGVGEPMAWSYASANGVVVVAIIGDPVPEKLRAASLYKLRERQGLNCVASVQGILLRANQISLSKKREYAGIFCAETGLEEKDFWMLAHP